MEIKNSVTKSIDNMQGSAGLAISPIKAYLLRGKPKIEMEKALEWPIIAVVRNGQE